MEETRKLIQQGGGGLVAYIPKQWCDAKNLSPGDTVTFTGEEDGSLRLNADTQDPTKRTRIQFTEEGRRYIWIITNHVYRAGYDQITVEYRSEEQFNELEQVVEQYLLGFEIVENDGGTAVVSNVTEPSPGKRRVLTRRIFLLIDELFTILGEDMENGAFTRYDRVLEIRKKIGQYDNFCRRTLSKKRFAHDAAFQWMLYIQLYLISHNLIHFYEAVKDGDTPLPGETRNLLAELHNHYESMYNGFFHEDVETLKHVNKPLDELYYQVQDEHLSQSTGRESVAQYYITELARLLYKTNSYPLLGAVFANTEDTPSQPE